MLVVLHHEHAKTAGIADLSTDLTLTVDRFNRDDGTVERQTFELHQRGGDLALVGIDHGMAPCHATFHYFRGRYADALSSGLGKLARGDGRACHIAIDGKTSQGSRRLEPRRSTCPAHSQLFSAPSSANLSSIPIKA